MIQQLTVRYYREIVRAKTTNKQYITLIPMC